MCEKKEIKLNYETFLLKPECWLMVNSPVENDKESLFLQFSVSIIKCTSACKIQINLSIVHQLDSVVAETNSQEACE